MGRAQRAPLGPLAAGFMFLQVLGALWLGAVARHGPAGLALAALAYVVLAPALTWWVARRLAPLRPARAVVSLLVAGGVLLALAPGALLALDELERRVHRRRVAATRVSEVRDEPIVSAAGRPIGVRVSYLVHVPSAGAYAIAPSLRSPDPAERLTLAAMQWTIDGDADVGRLEAGPHHQVFELYPTILAFSRGDERCVAQAPPLPGVGARAPLRVEIADTPYGAPWRGGREERTAGRYDLAELYRGVLAEGYRPCSPPGGR